MEHTKKKSSQYHLYVFNSQVLHFITRKLHWHNFSSDDKLIQDILEYSLFITFHFQYDWKTNIRCKK